MSIVSIGRAVGLIGALGIASVLSVASAEAQVSSSAASAITAKLRTVPSSVQSAYFETAITTAPLVTPTGGVYQNFRGSKGRGAIYWSTSTQARVIYGDLLTFFTNNGMDAEIGYPSTDPQSGSGASYGCASDTTVYQTFSRITVAVPGRPIPRQMQTLCANAKGRVSIGQVTFSGATTPRIGDVDRTREQVGGEDLEEEDDGWAEEDEEDWAAEEDEEEETSPWTGRTPNSSGSRSVGSTGSRSGTGVLTPR